MPSRRNGILEARTSWNILEGQKHASIVRLNYFVQNTEYYDSGERMERYRRKNGENQDVEIEEINFYLNSIVLNNYKTLSWAQCNFCDIKNRCKYNSFREELLSPLILLHNQLIVLGSLGDKIRSQWADFI